MLLLRCTMILDLILVLLSQGSKILKKKKKAGDYYANCHFSLKRRAGTSDRLA